MQFIYFLSAPLLFFSGFPQTIKLLQRKKSDDISAVTYFCTWLGVFLIFCNAIENKILSMIVSNGFSLVTLTLNLFLIIFFRFYANHTKTKP